MITSKSVDENFRQASYVSDAKIPETSYSDFYDFICNFLDTHPYTPPVIKQGVNRKAKPKDAPPPPPFNVLFVEWNGIDIPVSNQIRAVNIIKLHSSLNYVEHANKTAYNWYTKTMDYFIDIIFKDMEEVKRFHYPKIKHVEHVGKDGYYIPLDDVKAFMFVLAKIHFKGPLYRWFIGDPYWDEKIEGWLYVVLLPSVEHGFVVKYGRTINVKNRFNVYLQNLAEQFKSKGFPRVGMRMVKNISAGEKALGEEFEKHGYQRLKDIDEKKHGNEVFFIPGEFLRIFIDAQAVFNDFAESLGNDGYEDTEVLFNPEEEEWFKFKNDDEKE